MMGWMDEWMITQMDEMMLHDVLYYMQLDALIEGVQVLFEHQKQWSLPLGSGLP
jgi:hypothetical protein